MPQFRFAIRMPLSRERAFALYTDASRLTEWFPRAVAVEHLSAPMHRPGSTYIIRLDGLPDATEEILEVVPGALQHRRFVQARRDVGVWGDVRMYFRTVDGETEVEEVIEYGYLPTLLSPILRVFLDRSARTAMQRKLESFQHWARTSAHSSAVGTQHQQLMALIHRGRHQQRRSRPGRVEQKVNAGRRDMNAAGLNVCSRVPPGVIL